MFKQGEYQDSYLVDFFICQLNRGLRGHCSCVVSCENKKNKLKGAGSRELIWASHLTLLDVSNTEYPWPQTLIHSIYVKGY